MSGDAHPWRGVGAAGGQGPPPPGDAATPASDSVPMVERQLKGRLPCLRCRYDLGGLSVLGVCPECGTPIRATILAVVDPYASELQPIRWRWLTAAGLMLWSTGALAAALLTWGIRASDALDALGLPALDEVRLAVAATICVVLSGIGALSLVRPHAGIPVWKSAAAAAASLLFAPLAWVYHWLHAVHDPIFVAPYLETESTDPSRSLARLLIAALAAGILVGLRPTFHLLSARSLLLRSGRVERQTLYAVVIAVAVAALGDAFHLAGSAAGGVVQQATGIVGTLLIAVGSMLVTVGLAGIVVDVLRIVPVVLDPPPSMTDLLGDPQEPRRAGGFR